jgi:hypothetical protein
MARAAGLGALTACGLLLGQAGPAQGQRVSNAGDTTRDARPGNQVGNAGLGQDTEMLISHGLEMAIEGSTLRALAGQPGAAVVGPAAVVPGTIRTEPRAGVVPGTRVVPPGTAAPAIAVPVPPPVVNAIPRRTAAAPGTVVVERPVTPAPAAMTRVDVVVPAPVAVAVPTTASPSAATLRQQSQHAFEDSDRLLAQAARDAGSNRGLREATARYAATLRNLGAIAVPVAGPGVGNGTGGSGTYPSATSATGLGGTGNPITGPGGVEVATGRVPSVTGPGGVVAAPVAMTVDPAAVAAINHEVKEAIGAYRIRQMLRAIGSTDSPAAQFLMTHAREMETHSRSAIQAIANEAAATGPGPIQALAQQANDLIRALQGFGR